MRVLDTGAAPWSILSVKFAPNAETRLVVPYLALHRLETDSGYRPIGAVAPSSQARSAGPSAGPITSRTRA